jgi:hypothetical protein
VSMAFSHLVVGDTVVDQGGEAGMISISALFANEQGRDLGDGIYQEVCLGVSCFVCF